ncbi:hypothetical protein MHYP_G00121080 [Metynnis hypsauchen]
MRGRRAEQRGNALTLFFVVEMRGEEDRGTEHTTNSVAKPPTAIVLLPRGTEGRDGAGALLYMSASQ